MIRSLREYREIVEQVRKKSFPRIKNKKIYVIKFYSKTYHAGVTDLLYFYILAVFPKLNNSSLDEVRAVIAHELAHLELYSDKKFFDKLNHLTYFFSDNFRREEERKADLLTIKRGYGASIINHRQKFWRTANKKIKNLYLSPDKLKKLKNMLRK